MVSGEWSGGSLALITFHVKPDAPAGAAVINLMESVGSARTALGGTDGQGNNFLFDLQPRPSNVAGDVLDGSIDVLPAAVPAAPLQINESKVTEHGLDEFFSRYPAIVEDGILGEGQWLQVEKDLADLAYSNG